MKMQYSVLFAAICFGGSAAFGKDDSTVEAVSTDDTEETVEVSEDDLGQFFAPVANSGEETDSGSIDSSQSVTVEPTPTPVRLYLIDTAVDTVSGFFDDNPNLTLHPSKLIRGAQDPTSSTAFGHGTKVLSIIAAPEVGAAAEIPLEVISYDVFPNGEEEDSSAGLVGTAISNAITHHVTHPGTPGIICIALGSTSEEKSYNLEDSVEAAVGYGLTVVVAAGNSGTDASQSIPASYGSKAGVVAVGATCEQNFYLPMSNHGSCVGFYELGENVTCYDPETPTVAMDSTLTGTSASAALATATALRELSLYPGKTAAELEEHIKREVYGPSLTLAQVYPVDDSDGDGVVDSLEVLHGSDPAVAADRPQPITLSRQGSTVELTFSLASGVIDPATPYSLSTGESWEIRGSDDLKYWQAVDGTLDLGTSSGGKIPATFTVAGGDAKAFYRIELTPAMP